MKRQQIFGLYRYELLTDVDMTLHLAFDHGALIAMLEENNLEIDCQISKGKSIKIRTKAEKNDFPTQMDKDILLSLTKDGNGHGLKEGSFQELRCPFCPKYV